MLGAILFEGCTCTSSHTALTCRECCIYTEWPIHIHFPSPLSLPLLQLTASGSCDGLQAGQESQVRMVGISCTSCCKRRKRSAPTPEVTEKSVDPSSPAITRTSTTISPPRSPPVPSSQFVTDIPPISSANRHNLTGLTLVATSPQQPSPPLWGTYATDRTRASPLSNPPNTHISQGKQTGKDTSTVDSDPDNLDKIFDEAWKPGNGLKLADGSELPWSKSTSSPSAVAKYFDDIEDGL
ncbi:hypothetical protein V8F33_011207 [Rhypophila sp. PSN 637]